MEKLQRASHLSVVFMAVVALFVVLSAMKSIAAPLALALVMGVVLAPVSDFWERRGVPAATGALVNLLFALILLSILVLVFLPMVQELLGQVPKVWSDIQGFVNSARSLLQGALDVLREVSANVVEPAQASVPAVAAEPALPVETIGGVLLAAPAVAAQAMVFAGALFFFLMTRAELYAWVARFFSEPTGRGETVQRLRAAERRVSRYFVTITLINAGLGVATGLLLQLMGLPGAALWGFLAFILNFIVWIGPVALAGCLIFAGVAAFDGLALLLPALAFLALNMLEGQFVTPALLGRSLSLNPLLVFVALIFGFWLWGPIGGVVAIPILLWVLVLNDMLREQRPAAIQPAAA